MTKPELEAMKRVPVWAKLAEDRIGRRVLAELQRQAPEMVASVLRDHESGSALPDGLEPPPPAPAPKGPTQDEVASWSRAAIEAGALEGALVDVLNRIQHERPLADPSAPLPAFLDALKLDAPHLFQPAKKGNGRDRE